MSEFQIGDLVGQADGDEAVLIQITEVSADQIRATVVNLGRHFSSGRLTGGRYGTDSFGFILGETLVFRNGRDQGSYNQPTSDWYIFSPHQRPWHILKIKDGIKTFEHYR